MRKIAELIFGLSCLAAPGPAARARPRPLHWIQAHKLQIVADALIVGASALDVASTRAALSSGNREANSVYGKRPGLGRLWAVKAAIDVPVVVGNNFLDRYRRGESRWKRSEVLLPAAILSTPQIWAAWHNWKLAAAH